MTDTGVQTRSPSARAAWFAVVAPIVAWIAHLTGEASLVRLTCNSSGGQLPMHLLTAGCLALTLWAMSFALRMARYPEGPWRFIGVLALIIGGANLVLILLEGSYVLFINPCA
jgi:hypothetical protein